jgi:hypothetical protein
MATKISFDHSSDGGLNRRVFCQSINISSVIKSYLYLSILNLIHQS